MVSWTHPEKAVSRLNSDALVTQLPSSSPDYFRIGMSDLTDMKENHDPDIEFGDVITKIEQSDPRFKRIILEYDNLPPDKKDLLCDFFEKFVF